MELARRIWHGGGLGHGLGGRTRVSRFAGRVARVDSTAGRVGGAERGGGDPVVGREAGLIIERNKAGTWVRLNRPDRLNALSAQLQRRIVETFVELDQDEKTAVVVLGTTSSRAFSAGADLKEPTQRRWAEPMRLPQRN